MSIVPRGMSVTETYRLYRSGKLLVNRKYQRKLVWTIEEKEKLISSILKGYPIPLILLAERPKIHGNGRYEIIDGIQRFNAIFSFIENSFCFENKYFDVKEFPYAKELADQDTFKIKTEVDNISYLSRTECSNILDYQLAVTMYVAMEEEDITEVFNRINSGGKHLSNQEKRQAGVTTPFAEIVRTIAMKLRGDDSQKVLNLYNMPEISIDFKQSSQRYGIQAENTLWCKQGVFSISQLRDSQDEDMIADILASILLNEPLPRSTESLDNLYNKDSKYFKDIENSLAIYSLEKLEKDIIKTFSILRETIELHSTEVKILRFIVNPGSKNPIPQAFYTIFMAFFDLIIKQGLLPANPNEIMNALEKLQNRLSLSRRYTAIKDRKDNINQTKGLIQDYFAKQETSTLGQGADLIISLENSLLRSRIETTRYECKQGLLNLSPKRELNNNLIDRIIETICGIANVGPESDGYIFLGVADKEEDANRIKDLDKIQPIKIHEKYIVGIDREAKQHGQTLEKYIEILINSIKNSQLSETLKTQVLMKIDTICYKNHSVIRITVPAQTSVSFVGNKAFMRENSSTVEAEGPKLLAVFESFQKLTAKL
ncbi:MAG: DUF262 domain-containing protein [Trichodesmium sp. MO_231.B1]|nr:DUF262 domain-containing protein [Trichodesmium sp. MO_231.B1]